MNFLIASQTYFYIIRYCQILVSSEGTICYFDACHMQMEVGVAFLSEKLCARHQVWNQPSFSLHEQQHPSYRLGPHIFFARLAYLDVCFKLQMNGLLEFKRADWVGEQLILVSTQYLQAVKRSFRGGDVTSKCIRHGERERAVEMHTETN